MDGEFVNRTTLMLALRTICSQTILSADSSPVLSPSYCTTERPKTYVRSQGIAPLPGVFVSWKGTEQTIYEVQGSSYWTIVVPQHTPLSEVFRTRLPSVVAVKTVYNTVERPLSQRDIGVIRELPISWDVGDWTTDRLGVTTMRGTFASIPVFQDQTLHVIAQIRINAMRKQMRHTPTARSV